MNLTKKLEIDSSGVVTARVYNDGNQIASKFWMFRMFLETDDALLNRTNKAHKWADAYINKLKDVKLS